MNYFENYTFVEDINKLKIGNTYKVKKGYHCHIPGKKNIFTFTAKLTNIKYYNGVTYLGSYIHNFYFDNYFDVYENETFIYSDSENIPFGQPFPYYTKKEGHPHLYSVELYTMNLMSVELKKEIHIYSFQKIISEFEKKTRVPMDIITNVLLDFI